MDTNDITNSMEHQLSGVLALESVDSKTIMEHIIGTSNPTLNNDNAHDSRMCAVPTFIHTNRGGRILVFDGFLFRINRCANNGNTYWKCKVKQCRTTIVLDSFDVLISIHGHHTHESNELDGLHRRADILLKQQRRALLAQRSSRRPVIAHHMMTPVDYRNASSRRFVDLTMMDEDHTPAADYQSMVTFHRDRLESRVRRKRSSHMRDSSSVNRSVTLALKLMSRGIAEPKYEEQEEKYIIDIDRSEEDEALTTTNTTKLEVNSPNVSYTPTHIEAKYTYQTTDVTVDAGTGTITAHPRETVYTFRTNRTVPRLGVMLVGWGGNIGSTVTAAVLANRLGLSWPTKDGLQMANYYGSITQASTALLGSEENGDPVHVPLKALLPMVEPNDIVFDGWDISGMNLADAMGRARVLDYNLQQQLRPHMEDFIPRPSIYYPDFIAADQDDRADNIIDGGSKWDHLCRLRQDIRDFKIVSGLDKVIVVWMANTERFSKVLVGLNDTADSLLDSIRRSASEVSPSTVFAVASILEGAAFINGSPQNTCVPGVIDLASREKVFIGGDDLQSSPTKLKSVLVDFLVGTGIKPTSIVSCNHLGNNDGRNISAQKQFRSKEMAKSNVVTNMAASNNILYGPSEKPDHCNVNKYIPSMGDRARTVEEYTSEIMMGGTSTMSVHNTYDGSLLASPIILDLVILTEVCQRINFRVADEVEYQSFNSVLSLLSYLLRTPLVPDDTPSHINTLSSQRACVENVFRACIGLAPINHMLLEHKHEASGSKAAHVVRMARPTNSADPTYSNGDDDLINCNRHRPKSLIDFANNLEQSVKTELEENPN